MNANTSPISQVSEYQFDAYVNVICWACQNNGRREVFVGGRDGFLGRVRLL